MSCLWLERIVTGCRVSDLILPPILSYFSSSSENFYGILRATKCLMDAQLRCDVTDHDWCHLNFITILNPWYWAGLGHWDQGYQSACLNVIYPPLQMVMNYHHWRWCLVWKWKMLAKHKTASLRWFQDREPKTDSLLAIQNSLIKVWAPSNYQLSPQ